MSYAKGTSVPADRSMSQLRQLLLKNRADGVAIAETREGAAVQFVFERIPYKFHIHYPSGREEKIKFTPTGNERSLNQIDKEIDAEVRRLWRAMVLYVKAAIEAHENGLVDLKRSMMGNIMLPTGQTMYQKLEGRLDDVITDPGLLLS